ncbi:MAG: hypothetical protein CBB92_10015 [Flammeovirgaceae bacterium TMED32]|nr:MAG: hypothetical protein CBB92_10015 [Flammeovirgaceae bacterium TMED32]|tara:strand:+ start:178 stop:477 length:300 start_codon:yes stop_codon:yes gene_type:complete
MNKTVIIILMVIALRIMTIIASKKKYKFVITTITEIHMGTLYVELPSDTIFLSEVQYISKPIHDTIYVHGGDSIANYSEEFFVDSAFTVLYNIDVKVMI